MNRAQRRQFYREHSIIQPNVKASLKEAVKVTRNNQHQKEILRENVKKHK